MIEIKSFLKTKNSFINILEFKEKIEDEFYINGAITISINGNEFMTFELWDLVDQLWAYIAEGIASISRNKEFETYFPDQPIKLSFIPLNKYAVKLTLDRSGTTIESIVNKQLFIKSASEAGMLFFSSLKQLLPPTTIYDESIANLELAIASLN